MEDVGSDGSRNASCGGHNEGRNAWGGVQSRERRGENRCRGTILVCEWERASGRGGVSLGRGDVAPATKCQIGVGSTSRAKPEERARSKKREERAYGHTRGFN